MFSAADDHRPPSAAGRAPAAAAASAVEGPDPSLAGFPPPDGEPAPAGRASAAPARPPAPRPGRLIVRALVTGAILGALLLWLPELDVWTAMRRVSPLLWGGVLAAAVAGHAVAALKWRVLLAASGARVGARDSFQAHGAGLFASLFLPSVAGGDVVRLGVVLRRGRNRGALAMGSLADRLVDTVALVLLAGSGALLSPGTVDPLATRVIWICGALLVGGIAAAPFALALLDRRGLPGRAGEAVRKARAALRSLGSHPGPAAAGLALSILVQGSFVALNARIGAAMGISLTFAVWLLAWPVAKLVALLPVSISGLGVREAVMAAMLLPHGIHGTFAVGQSLVWETILVGLGIAGGSASWLLRRRPATDPGGTETPAGNGGAAA